MNSLKVRECSRAPDNAPHELGREPSEEGLDFFIRGDRSGIGQPRAKVGNLLVVERAFWVQVAVKKSLDNGGDLLAATLW